MQLYPSQKDALRKLRSGAILNGDVGSGKSITALAYYCYRYGGDAETLKPFNGAVHPLYIITTAQKRDLGEWNCELAKIGVTDDKHSYSGICATVDSWQNIKKYKDVKHAFFIFDEQRLTGKGAWVKAFLKIQKVNDWIMLSATPGDTWLDYIPVFIANGYYKNRTEFLREHVIFDYQKKFPVVRGYLNETKLERYRKAVLVEMPVIKHTQRHYKNLRVSFNNKEYTEITKRRWDPYNNLPIKNLSQYCALQRYCVNRDSSRLEAVKKLLSEHKRAIIFYNFDYELEILRELKKIKGRSYGERNGHCHDECPISDSWTYIVQYQSGAEGWECPQCDTIIFYSGTYSFRTFAQACGRIDRVNTTYKDLYYYSLYSSAHIDYRIQECLKAKKNFNILDDEREFYIAGRKMPKNQ